MTIGDQPGAQLVVVIGRDRPHEVAFNVWALVIGAALTIGAPRPGSMASLVQGPAYYVFTVGLLLGGAIALFGSYWNRNLEVALEVERGGLLMLTGALLVYFVALIAVFGWQALVAGGLVGAWMYANLRRSVVISRDLGHVRANLRKGPT